jgi:hypothetical protein
MNREVHVRFWERAEVKFLRATRQSRRFGIGRGSARPPIPDVLGAPFTRREPLADIAGGPAVRILGVT